MTANVVLFVKGVIYDENGNTTPANPRITIALPWSYIVWAYAEEGTLNYEPAPKPFGLEYWVQ
jgi:hypothetical protein